MPEPKPTRPIKLELDLSDLIIAAESQSDGGGYLQSNAYLDMETGQAVIITDDARYYLDEDEIGDLDLTDDEAFAQFVHDQSIPDWISEMVQHAWRIESQPGDRYRELPSKRSYQAYEDMQRFIDTLDDNRMVARLEKAIVGKGAFRRFKDALHYDEKVLQAWYDYKNQAEEAWILEWLADEGIEVISEK